MPEPFSPEQQATLQITMHVVSVISMVACIAVFVVLFRFERLQTMMNKMIAWLTLCDFFLSLAFAFGTYPIRNSVACTIQGSVVEFMFIASSAWNFCISLHCYLLVRTNLSRRVPESTFMWCYHSLVWGAAALFTAALFVLQAVLQRGPVMGDAQLECWISDEYKEFRIYFFYLILWVEYAAIVGMYVLVFMKVKSITDEAYVDTSVTIALTKGRKRIIAKALSLAIGVAVCWIPATISRLVSWASHEVPYELYLAQAMTMPAHGLSDALIFLVFAFIVKFSSTTGSVSMVSLGEQSRRRITSGNSDNQSFC